MMPKWSNGAWMRGVEKSRHRKMPSFRLNPSFPHHLRRLRMTRDENFNGEDIIQTTFRSIWGQCCTHEWSWMTGWQWNEGVFQNQGRTLNSEIVLIPRSVRHSIPKSYCSRYHSIHFGVIRSYGCHPKMRSKSKTYHSDAIQLFCWKTLIGCCLL